MTPEQFKSALAAAGLATPEAAPDPLGRDRSRIYAYLSGSHPVPEDVEIRLYAMRDAPELYRKWLREARS